MWWAWIHLQIQTHRLATLLPSVMLVLTISMWWGSGSSSMMLVCIDRNARSRTYNHSSTLRGRLKSVLISSVHMCLCSMNAISMRTSFKRTRLWVLCSLLVPSSWFSQCTSYFDVDKNYELLPDMKRPMKNQLSRTIL